VPLVGEESECVVVSAQHCQSSAGADATFYIRVPLAPADLDLSHPPYVWETEQIPIDDWEHEADVDVSAAALKLERLSETHILLAWPMRAFVGTAPGIFGERVLSLAGLLWVLII
jgi:hypothetical protein